MRRDGHQRRSDGADAGQRGLAPVDATDGNPLGLPGPTAPSRPRLRRWLGLFGFALLSLAMLATVIVVSIASEKKTSLLQAEERRLKESLLGRAKIVQTWLHGQLAASRRLTESDVFRLFVADLALHDPKTPLPRSLQDQRPYFRQLMADFAHQNSLVRATVLRDDGALLLSSPGPGLAAADLAHLLKRAQSEEPIVLSPIRQINDRQQMAVVDILIAFPEAQRASDTPREPSAFLVLTMPVESMLQDALSNRLAEPDHDHIALFQWRGAVVDRIQVSKDGIAFTEGSPPGGLHPDAPIPFALRDDDGRPVYSLAEPLEDVGWALYQALDARTSLSPVHDFIKVAAGLAVMAVILLTAVFSAIWWRQGRNHYQNLVKLHLAHAMNIEHQRQFLKSVTTSIGDWLIVSAPNGDFIYTNPAFDTLFERTTAPISEEGLNALTERPSATKTQKDDIASLIEAGAFEVIDLGGDRRVITTHASELISENGAIAGRVRIVRDHTKLAIERRRRLKSVTQTVDAFVHAIELRDPFLVGHTRRVRSHAIAIGQRLELSNDDLAALALAASLSQIGKIFIPDDVLAKPDRHNPEEEGIMRDHILHAIDILERLDFDLPVVGILAQMHERLDGSGYPHGVSGGQIGLSARILGVADIYCARTAPRSYRDRLSTGKTLYHLASNERRYDVAVVAALADIVGREGGLDDVATIGRSFVDAAIWQDPGLGAIETCQPAGST